MDLLRSCYRSKMRLFSDRPDVLTDGQWFWCPDGAKPIPFMNRFVSQSQDYKHLEGSPAVGEYRGRGAWLNGACPPQYTGTHFCGEVEAWQNGILYADRPGLPIGEDGYPSCCPHLPMHGAELGLQGSAPVYQFVNAKAKIGLKATAMAGIQWACVPSRVMPRQLVVRFTILSGGTCSAVANPLIATFDSAHSYYLWTVPTTGCPSGQILSCNAGPTPLAVGGIGLCDNLNWAHGATTTLSITPFHVQHFMTSNGFFCPFGMVVQVDITET
jgi:hypothetical protein